MAWFKRDDNELLDELLNEEPVPARPADKLDSRGRLIWEPTEETEDLMPAWTRASDDARRDAERRRGRG